MRKDNLYINDTNFQLDGIYYESECGRYYMLVDSVSLRSDCDGKLVKKRIKKADYLEALNTLKRK